MKINLDKQSRAIIRNIFLHKEYATLQLLMEEMIKDIKGGQIGEKPSEWALTQETLRREGKVAGVIQFLKLIEQISNEEEKRNNNS